MNQHPAWLLIIVGSVLVGLGVLWLFAPLISGLGKLPGDIQIEREHVRFNFPIVTCIVLSLILSGILWLIRNVSR